MRSAQGMPTSVVEAKIACLDFNLQRHRMQMGVSMIVNDPAELEKIKKREADITKERIDKILKAGANVIVTTKAIDDLCSKYLVESGVIGLRRVTKRDLQRLARCTGATILSNLADLDGNESCDASSLGACDEVCEEMVADQPFIFFKKCKGSGAATIVLRGANDFMLDEVERSLHDSLMVVKRTMESKKIVAGGGAVEAACSVHLEDYATRLGTREQLAVQEFSEALLVIPKTLAVNAAQDASELVAKLRAMHSLSQQESSKSSFMYRGLDLIKGKVIDTLANGVMEPALSKVKSLRFATEAAITIMRIDDFIKLNPKEQPQQGRR